MGKSRPDKTKAAFDKPGKRMSRKVFDRELERLQAELCHLQSWVVREGLRVVVVFEGRDAAGKGGVIKRITERVSPRVFRVVALPKPNEREKSQLYMQRYITHFPAAGEVVLFDRSWYNRAVDLWCRRLPSGSKGPDMRLSRALAGLGAAYYRVGSRAPSPQVWSETDQALRAQRRTCLSATARAVGNLPPLNPRRS